jgi:hypothetical protein
MKIVIAASLLATASAFAPSQQSYRSVAPVQATAELDSMIGVDTETGNKTVSRVRMTCLLQVVEGLHPS